MYSLYSYTLRPTIKTKIIAEFTLQIQVLLGHSTVTFEGSKLLQNVSNHFLINTTASYHIGPEYSPTPLQEPQISQFNLVTATLLQIKIHMFFKRKVFWFLHRV